MQGPYVDLLPQNRPQMSAMWLLSNQYWSQKMRGANCIKCQDFYAGLKCLKCNPPKFEVEYVFDLKLFDRAFQDLYKDDWTLSIIDNKPKVKVD